MQRRNPKENGEKVEGVLRRATEIEHRHVPDERGMSQRDRIERYDVDIKERLLV